MYQKHSSAARLHKICIHPVRQCRPYVHQINGLLRINEIDYITFEPALTESGEKNWFESAPASLIWQLLCLFQQAGRECFIRMLRVRSGLYLSIFPHHLIQKPLFNIKEWFPHLVWYDLSGKVTFHFSVSKRLTIKKQYMIVYPHDKRTTILLWGGQLPHDHQTGFYRKADKIRIIIGQISHKKRTGFVCFADFLLTNRVSFLLLATVLWYA